MTELNHRCRSNKHCANRTEDGAAVTLKPDTLCSGCIDEIQKLYDSLPDLRLGVAYFLGLTPATSYGSKVRATKEPRPPMNVHVFDLLVELDSILDAPKKPVRDIVNSGDVVEALNIRRVARKAEGVLGLERKWERRAMACPQCSLPTLGNWSGSSTITCSSCGATMTRDEYEAQCLIQGDKHG